MKEDKNAIRGARVRLDLANTHARRAG